MNKLHIMSRRLKLFFIGGIAFFCFYFWIQNTYAVQVFLESTEKEVSLGQSFEVGVYVHTEGEEINAIEGKIKIPSDIFVLQDVKDGSSFISFWIERPQKNIENDIVFSGIIPGGYQQNKGFLFSFLVQAIKQEKGILQPYDILTLLNDGEGTATTTKSFRFSFDILQKKEQEKKQESDVSLQDKDMPEKFTPIITQNKDMEKGKQCVVFSTTDKESGIDHYEVLETKDATPYGGEWHRAASPYVLQDQDLKSSVYVKAIDKAGNKRIEKISPLVQKHYFFIAAASITGIFFLIVGIFVYLIIREKYKKNRM